MIRTISDQTKCKSFCISLVLYDLVSFLVEFLIHFQIESLVRRFFTAKPDEFASNNERY